MSLSDYTPPWAPILMEVDEERVRQDAKWGEQNHPDGTGSRLQILRADIARDECDAAFANGCGTWRHILEEEVREAYGAAELSLRAELIQVAAVAVAWVEAIDRRGGAA